MEHSRETIKRQKTMDPGSGAYREDVEVRHTRETIKEAKTRQNLDPGSRAYRDDGKVQRTWIPASQNAFEMVRALWLI